MAIQYGRIIQITLPDTGLSIISEPRIDIDVQCQADSDQNWAQVQIYNLARDTVSVIEKRGEKVFIDAGYESLGGARRIFEGVIQQVDRSRTENSFVVHIEASDNLRTKQVKGGHISQTFSGDTGVRQIAGKIVEAMKKPDGEQVVGIGSLAEIPTSATIKDFRAEGKPAEVMDRLLSQAPGDIRWYIDSVNIARFDNGFKPRADAPKIVKTPKTGLIGTPDREEDGRMSCMVLIDPTIKLGSEFRIEESDYIDASIYKVVGMEYQGTNFRGQFMLRIDALPPDYKENP